MLKCFQEFLLKFLKMRIFFLKFLQEMFWIPPGTCPGIIVEIYHVMPREMLFKIPPAFLSWMFFRNLSQIFSWNSSTSSSIYLAFFQEFFSCSSCIRVFGYNYLQYSGNSFFIPLEIFIASLFLQVASQILSGFFSRHSDYDFEDFCKNSIKVFCQKLF